MWDQRYAVDEYVYGTLPNDFLVSRVAALPRGRVLCLGEGEGRNAAWLAGTRGHHRFMLGPCSTIARDTTRSSADRPALFSAFAMADFSVFRM